MITETPYTLELKPNLSQIIKVIGVGGAGGNALLFMYNNGFKDVDFIACNTDAQALKQFPEDITRLQLGALLTKGLGAGTDWRVGKQAAVESEQAILELLGEPTEMVFITAGMGGGTGTGAAPEIARIAKAQGRLTIGVITYPFRHEGLDKLEQAENGINKLKENCDTVLVIKNDRLIEMYGDLDLDSAYKKADEVLADSVKSIAELITRPGVINADFADVKTVLGNAGHAVMGSAEASGPDRAFLAIEAALTTPLLESNNIKGAKKILMSIAYSDELPEYKIKMSDQGKITDYIESKIKNRAQIFKHGFAIDRTLKDKIRVTVVAAKFDTPTGEVDKTEFSTRVGAGIDNLIPQKPAVASTLAAQKSAAPASSTPQISLFEQDDRFVKSVNQMIKNGYLLEELLDEPAYKRYGVELVEYPADDSSLDKFTLNALYQGLTKEVNI
ncbi:MAG: cell division protein FtsZ [Leadbetterella sp.]